MASARQHLGSSKMNNLGVVDWKQTTINLRLIREGCTRGPHPILIPAEAVVLEFLGQGQGQGKIKEKK